MLLIATNRFTGYLNPKRINYVSIRKAKIAEEHQNGIRYSEAFFVEVNFDCETITVECFSDKEKAEGFMEELIDALKREEQR